MAYLLYDSLNMLLQNWQIRWDANIMAQLIQPYIQWKYKKSIQQINLSDKISIVKISLNISISFTHS